MPNLGQHVRRFAGCESGISSIEYALLLAFMAVALINVWGQVGEGTRETLEDIGNEIEKN